ncbi:ABC-type Co2+ transport system, permease component [Zea mays]|jgi:hypothetical protein|uniref:ABC-type Co2+ transport system, permease component n=1 Tax=Zea mays TaxID=4577 RepID=B6U434_MAIZE|nr:ABC-type Co2+ transport system, permease component [Zea mays]ACG44117.1 ABC-type Co2+ transport system, permease component [Zea mays]ONL99477.1 ABC-type Co2+ transport system, permease component [Zea mays]|eukprot:NP_001151720.1 ABC-type Co2+ transport system, permease component [Zea mays]
MAALLHQAATPTAKPPHRPWALNSTHSRLSPLSKRRRAPAIRSAATDSSFSSGETPSKKTTRKEKQQERRRQQDVQERQQQLLGMEEASLAKQDGGGSNGEVDDDDELPQPVFDRILRRIAFTVGLPMASGVALLNVYDALKRGQGVVVPSWVPLLTILVAFGTSALGIAYGTLSASWDPDKEGSLLGIDEARANWPVLWQEEIEKQKAKQKKK